MNKLCKIFFLLLISFFVFIFDLDVDALTSVKTYDRTEQNLLVPDYIVVTEKNKEAILDTPAVDQSQKVYDFANLLSNDEEAKIYKKIKNYIDNTSMQLIILTSNDVGDKKEMDYMYDFYDYNHFFREGIIFFIYKSSSEYKIFMGTVGNESSYIYTDNRINQTLAYVYKDLEDEKIYKCLSNYIKIVDGFYGLSKNENAKINENGEVVKGFPWIEIIVLSSTLTFVIMMLLIMHGNKKGIVTIVDRLDKDTIVIKKRDEKLVDTDLKEFEKK